MIDTEKYAVQPISFSQKNIREKRKQNPIQPNFKGRCDSPTSSSAPASPALTEEMKPPASSLFKAVFFLLVALAGIGAFGRREPVSFRSSEGLIQLAPSFGCKNGSVELDLSLTPSGAIYHVTVYDQEQWRYIQRHRRDSASLCVFPSILRYEFIGRLHVRATLKEEAQYTAVLLNCREKEISGEGRVTFLGQDQSHVSLEERPLALLSFTLMCSFAVSLAFWCTLRYVQRRWRRDSNAAARADEPVFLKSLLLVLLLAVLEQVLATAHHITYADSGVTYLSLKTTQTIVYVSLRMLMMIAVLSASLGWTVTRSALTLRERQVYWAAFILYTTFTVLHAFSETPSSIQYAYRLSLEVVQVLIWFGVLLAIGGNIGRLRGFLASHPKQEAETRWKLNLMNACQKAFFVYLAVAPVVSPLGAVLLPWQRAWLPFLLEQLALFIALNSVLYALIAVPRPLSNAPTPSPSSSSQPTQQLPLSASSPPSSTTSANGAASGEEETSTESNSNNNSDTTDQR
ncbi:hypothetical protein QOT17_006497 [Balamuthia mandrillaris]